jgi:hypothetical protein
MKTHWLLLVISSIVISFASSEPCQRPQKIESKDILFIGRLVKEELLEFDLKIKIQKRHMETFTMTKLTFLVDTTLFGLSKDTIYVLQSLDGDGYQNFIVGAQYCMHARYTNEITFGINTISINAFITSECLMQKITSYVKGVALEERAISDIHKYCIIP